MEETEEITTIKACQCLSTLLSQATLNYILSQEDLSKHPLRSTCKVSLWSDSNRLYCWMGTTRYCRWMKDTSEILLEDDVQDLLMMSVISLSVRKEMYTFLSHSAISIQLIIYTIHSESMRVTYYIPQMEMMWYVQTLFLFHFTNQ